MWLSVMVAIALITLAIVGYLIVSQSDTPINDNNLYMMVYEDGLLEVFFGVLLATAGILLDVYAGMVAILFALLYPFLLSAKRFITKPRFDPADLPADVAKRRQLSMFVVLGLGLLVGILTFLLLTGFSTTIRPWLDIYLLPSVVLIIAALLSLWAYRTGEMRLYLYATFVLTAYVASFWLTLAFPIYLVAIGIGITLVGLFTLVRFIQEHPKLSAAG